MRVAVGIGGVLLLLPAEHAGITLTNEKILGIMEKG
jgi:hypothetical protein